MDGLNCGPFRDLGYSAYLAKAPTNALGSESYTLTATPNSKELIWGVRDAADLSPIAQSLTFRWLVRVNNGSSSYPGATLSEGEIAFSFPWSNAEFDAGEVLKIEDVRAALWPDSDNQAAGFAFEGRVLLDLYCRPLRCNNNLLNLNFAEAFLRWGTVSSALYGTRNVPAESLGLPSFISGFKWQFQPVFDQLTRVCNTPAGTDPNSYPSGDFWTAYRSEIAGGSSGSTLNWATPSGTTRDVRIGIVYPDSSVSSIYVGARGVGI
jgi:hypothetical protein